MLTVPVALLAFGLVLADGYLPRALGNVGFVVERHGNRSRYQCRMIRGDRALVELIIRQCYKHSAALLCANCFQTKVLKAYMATNHISTSRTARTHI